MKKLLTLGSLAGIMLFSCNKNNPGISPNPAAGLNVVNATIGSSPLIIRQGNTGVIYSKIPTTQQVSYGANLIFGPAPGTYNYQFVQNIDTLHIMTTVTQSFQSGQTYSLFLAGSITQPDQFVVQDQILTHAASDSTGSVRFVNLSAGSNPVSVDLKGMANGSETASLAYKGITTFKNYAATYTVVSYIFEFRDQVSGTLLASYTISGVNNATGTNTTANIFRYMNMTLALIGQPGGTGAAAQKIILINNY